MPTSSPDIFLAFLAGLVSFLSPCVLPLVPAYIGYMSGSALGVARGKPAPTSRVAARNATAASAAPPGRVAPAGAAPATTVASTATATMPAASVAPVPVARPRPRAEAPPTAMSAAAARGRVFLHALLFVAGLTLVFVVVIGGLAGVLSAFLQENKRYLQYFMGAMLVVFGLHMMGAINIPFLNYTRRLDMGAARKASYARSLFIGMGFGIGWTPCIGPTLGAILTLAVNGRSDQAFVPVLAYSLGLGVPFLLTALATGQISGWLKRITRRSFTFKMGNWTVLRDVNIISLVSGVLLIFMGALIFTNSLAIIAPAINWEIFKDL